VFDPPINGSLVEIYVDTRGFLVAKEDSGGWTGKYGMFSQLNDDVVIHTIYSKKLKVSLQEMQRFVIDFLNTHSSGAVSGVS
jgi:hypothetical protein